MWKNQIYTFTNRTAKDAIVGWTYLLRRDCNSTAYGGIDLTPFCQLMLDPPSSRRRAALHVPTSGINSYIFGCPRKAVIPLGFSPRALPPP